ncbi:hypothetical protein [Streptomyces soliscabiei]|uniref:hypothetical protein n=1 Tax=Streptomyces soliscabiei TaxID=588897 RepID=UPI0029A02EFF|nr:hypothetical protein [Streptomyces sp. NY05-11A]MDX2681492.1 hypothetical protein [Streptomyces sp. NY05-11A]
MSDFDHEAAGKEARRVAPRRSWTPEEEHRQDALRRYLGALASVAAAEARAGAPETGETDTAPTRPRPDGEQAPEAPCVRDVMRVPAVSVPGDMPFHHSDHVVLGVDDGNGAQVLAGECVGDVQEP